MHIGIKLPNWGPLASSDSLFATATLAERRGFDSVWVSDHVIMPMEPAPAYPFTDDGTAPFDPTTPFHDPFVTLAWVGSITRRVQLGTGVLVLPLRHPVHVAKQVATLDALSGGRVVLGVGVGWMKEEFELVDQPFAGRGHRTDEAITAMRACWADDPVELGGGRPDRAAMNPKPVRGAAVPILVGGHSDAALDRAARLGDGWYGANVDAATFESLALEVRRRRGNERPGSAFRVGVKLPVAEPGDAARLEKEYADAGADFVVFDVNFALTSTTEACATITGIADELALDDHGGAGAAI